jgi:hypothetical protein
MSFARSFPVGSGGIVYLPVLIFQLLGSRVFSGTMKPDLVILISNAGSLLRVRD